MSGGDNINNIQSMYSREKRYIEGIKKIRRELQDINNQPVRFVTSGIDGLIDYIGGLLDE